MLKYIGQTLSRFKLLPVVTIDNPGKAVRVSNALEGNGLPLIEITFRTGAAAESIRRIRKNNPQMCIGAGTVLSIDQVRKARKAGADFVVAPGFNPRVVDYCIENTIPVIPGVDSPTLIEAALEKGLGLVKFFPAEQSGGIGYLKAVASPYRDMRFMPTGGISPDNLTDYLGFEKVIACGGSWIAPSSLIAADDFDRIAQRTRNALAMIR